VVWLRAHAFCVLEVIEAMGSLRIIHIYQRNYSWRFPEKDTDYYYLSGWSGLIARYVEKSYPGLFQQEVWRPESDVRKLEERTISGIRCRLIPLTQFQRQQNLDFVPVVRELRRVIADGRNTIIHHSSIHSRTLYAILAVVRGASVVAQQHGDVDPVARWRFTGKKRLVLSAAVERRLLPRLGKAWYLRNIEGEYLRTILAPNLTEFLTVGVDYDLFRPIDKRLARKKLGLAPNKPICLHVGVLDDRRGVCLLLQAFERLQREGKAPFLMLLGNSPSDKYASWAKELGARIVPFVPHTDMPYYYSAADFLCSPGFTGNVWRGFDVSLMESLACGTPVVSNMLWEIKPDDATDCGLELTAGDDLGRKLLTMQDCFERFKNCTEVSRRYFSWDVVTRKIMQTYEQLAQQYSSTNV
jgi:glycosyltransferase involved in cell wall biosynthesis